MRNNLIIIFLLSGFSLNAFSQSRNNTRDLEIVNQFYSNPDDKMPASNQSIIETVDGFDNFRLGTDLAESMIATNPTDPLNSICGFNTNRVYYTLDGVNWNNVNAMSGGFADPFICFDNLGNAYYTATNSTFQLAKSTNKGISWSNYTIYNSNNFDKESIFCDQSNGPFSNYLYVTWQWLPSNIYLSRSTNGGINWSAPSIVNIANNAYCSWLAIGPNNLIPGGSLYCGYNNGISADSDQILVRRSTDGGLTFLTETLAVNFLDPGDSVLRIKNSKVQINSLMQMSADNSFGPYRGNVYIVYCSKTSNIDLSDIYFIRSTDYGVTWSVPRKVNDDNTNTDQWFPSLVVDKNTGKIFISWYDSRIDPINNLQTKLFATVSTDGGLSFFPNSPVSTISFNPQNIVTNFSGTGYMGHYYGISPIGNESYASWVDGRNNNLGSYAGYYPDFAMLTNPNIVNLGSNDSVTIVVKVPAINGPFSDRIKFTAALDTVPQIGNIQYNFIGRDFIVTIPDSLYLKIRIVGVTIPKLYRLFITAHGISNGVPVHIRTINLLVNSSFLTIGTNRNGEANFKVNGITYNTLQQLPFPNGTNITVQEISPYVVSYARRYVFQNWSDNGDTTHSFIINNNINLTAYYKTQFGFYLLSMIDSTFGNTDYYDSLQPHTFGVLARNVLHNGVWYTFKGWGGYGYGSYSSPDTTGNDTSVTVILHNFISETASWLVPIGIKNISSQIPKEYKSYQNYPNPFNPSTTFKFDLPKESFTKLIIYDLLGKEVAIVVNAKLQAGSYEIQWDASNCASGVYFYIIQMGDFIQSKKMILLK